MSVRTGSIYRQSIIGAVFAGLATIFWVYLFATIIRLALGDAALFVGSFMTAAATEGTLWLGRFILIATALLWGALYPVVRRVLPGEEWQRGLIYGLLVWLVSTTLILPYLALVHPQPGIVEEPGMLALGFGGVSALLLSLTAHLLFGVLLGVWVQRVTE